MDRSLNTPTVLVIFGATGDLAKRKIFPSLYHLYTKNKLPKMLQVIGFSRRKWSDEKFKKLVKEKIRQHKDAGSSKEKLKDFVEHFYYHSGNFEHLDDFRQLAERLGNIDGEWKTCANKLFYLAVPPKYYKTLFKHLEKSKLTEPCSEDEGWTRVIVEKPFGKDLKTARELDEMLSKLFKEEQIFRIDHYLGKDMLQNILAFRFSNTIFEQSWSNKYIDSIEVKLLEKDGIGERGTFYDGVGALRDVGQNHLLQMVSLITMPNVGSMAPELIRKSRLEILDTLEIPSKEFILENTFRAQYESFTKEEGVLKESRTETYFKSEAVLHHPRWKGVRITLEGGKATGERKKEIVVRFKHPHPCLCPPGSDHGYHNKVIFAIEPKEEITFRLWYKKPGFDLDVEKRSFDLGYRRKSKKHKYTEEYEKLLLDCFSGDQTLFVSTDEVEATWKFIDPILKVWEEGDVPLTGYKKGDKHIRDKANEKLNEFEDEDFVKQIGIVGLGKMGENLALNLIDHGWKVVGYNRTPEVTKKLEKNGLTGVYSYQELYEKLVVPRIVWVMVPAGDPVNEVIKQLSETLAKGDIVIDGGNTFFEDSKDHHKLLSKKSIDLVDVGVSGGPEGAKRGASLMIGGNEKLYDYLLPLFVDLATDGGYEHFEGVGAGHFVKMVHNGIEYGMMQSIAEGFDVMKNSDYKLHLQDIARVYNHGSVIESRLISWMEEAFRIFGDDLKKVSGSAGSGGNKGMVRSEAKWTVDVAGKLGVETEVIKRSIEKRVASQKKASYQGKIINALRNMFGGHSVKKED